MKLKNNFYQCLWILTYRSLLLRKIKKNIFLTNYAIILKKFRYLRSVPNASLTFPRNFKKAHNQLYNQFSNCWGWAQFLPTYWNQREISPKAKCSLTPSSSQHRSFIEVVFQYRLRTHRSVHRTFSKLILCWAVFSADNPAGGPHEHVHGQMEMPRHL